MKITKNHLTAATHADIITPDQADRLYDFLNEQTASSPSFNVTHVLYYSGGMIAIGAMTLFMTLGWESFGGAGIVVISLMYAALGLVLIRNFDARGLAIPAGIVATFVVCLAPLAIYGLQQWLGFWPDDSVYREYHRYIKWHWIYMELGTLAAGAIMVWRYRYPFLIMPVAVTLWYMTMDLSAMLAGGDNTWELRKLVSMYTGLLMIIIAVWIDLRSTNGDYAFWIYLFGALAFWCGLTFQSSDSELAKFFYFCINLLMIGAGVLIVRRVFVVFGAAGCAIYLSHLASNVFEDSWLFPVALSVIGLGVVYLGILWQKHEKRITEKSRRLLPERLRMVIEARG